MLAAASNLPKLRTLRVSEAGLSVGAEEALADRFGDGLQLD